MQAAKQNIPILLDAEKKRPGLDDLLHFSDYVVCSAKFPQAWTEAPSLPSALISMLHKLPKLKFAIVTLGEHGCLMLERSSEEKPLMEEEDADSLWRSLKQDKDDHKTEPTCNSSVMCFSSRCQRSLLHVLLLCFWPVTDARTTFSKLQQLPSTDNNFRIVERRLVKYWIMRLNLSTNCITDCENAASN